MTYQIKKLSQIIALASPVRQEILEVVNSLGPCAASDISDAMNHPLDGLYYHINLMLNVGLLIESDKAPPDSRRVRLFETMARGEEHEIWYNLRNPKYVDAIERVAYAMTTSALDEFSEALLIDGIIASGSRRRVRAIQFKGWMSDDELVELNTILMRLRSLFHPKAGAGRHHFQSLSILSAPASDKSRQK